MKKIFVAGHMGMVGSAICRKLTSQPNVQVITRSRTQLDLCDQNAVKKFMKSERPDEVILAAAKVGGIHANSTYPADFIYQNLQIQSNVIHFAHMNNVQKFLFLGSSCIYPIAAKQPMSESILLSGKLEPTNEPYAIAKIAGIKMCESYNRQYGRDYRSVMPTNLYGPCDNYHPENSHVVPALISRFHKAKVHSHDKVIVWGSGKPMREFLFVDDMAEASLFVHQLNCVTYQKSTKPLLSHLNVGTGTDITIAELAETIKLVVGFKGLISYDLNKPDGILRKVMDISQLNKLGWQPRTNLLEGIKLSYNDFLNNHDR